MNWFLPIALFASLSVRTPNILPNPYDYEVSIGMEKPRFKLNHQWEREAGKYITQDFYDYNYKRRNLAIAESYVFTTGLNYNKVSISGEFDGFTMGYGLYHVDKIPSHRLVAGFNYDKRFNFLIADGKAVINLNGNTNFKESGYSVVSDVSFGLMRNLEIGLNLRAEKMNEKDFFQAKTFLKLNLLGDKNG